ncbi:MAG TPA: hypothetical protein PKZ20_16440 [Rhodocyclaceae bacterium]|nr:hypothetical protein [Rhodocyclaceae bacterium]
MSTENLIDALSLTAEAMGQQLTPAGLLLMADDLAEYPLDDVLGALRRVRRECRRLTVADVMERMAASDGRPDADEAWMVALSAQHESATVVWTRETEMAWHIARPAIEINDKVGARMAFKAAYDRLVAEARDHGVPVKWSASLGFNVEERRQALENAVLCGKIQNSEAAGLLPPPPADERIAKAVLKIACVNGETVAPEVERREMVRRHIADLRAILEKKA